MTDTGNKALELKPCPFCGGKPYLQANGRDQKPYWEVVCDNACDFTGPAKWEKDEAVSAWNTRAIATDFAALEARATELENLSMLLEAERNGCEARATAAEERVKRLEAALTELVDAQSNDAGEIDRRLAMKDARAALAGDKP